jgi:NAD(P)-dependent dehydrogenase (short-subunit alcohol dehydrogenase family)
MKNNIFDLSGQTAFVCGGSSGLGFQFAKALANAGANVAIVARRKQRLEENAREIEKEYGVQAYPHYMDLLDSKTITDCVGDVVKHFGKIDILVNSAGIPGAGDPSTLSDEDWLKVINTDLNGQFYVCREVARQSMKPNKYGRIVMVASIHAVAGRKGVDTASYAAAKGGVLNLTRSLANSWARDNITVNCICPGYFPTEMTAAYIDAPFFKQAHMECCPMERHGIMGEMDGICTYFASPACSYTTGQYICIDGGWSCI